MYVLSTLLAQPEKNLRMCQLSLVQSHRWESGKQSTLLLIDLKVTKLFLFVSFCCIRLSFAALKGKLLCLQQKQFGAIIFFNHVYWTENSPRLTGATRQIKFHNTCTVLERVFEILYHAISRKVKKSRFCN